MKTLPTELILALRRQITNLREMIAAAQENSNARPTYIQELKKQLRSAEKKLFG